MVTTPETLQRNSKGQYLPGNGPFQPGVSGNPKGKPLNSVTMLLKNKSPQENQAIADKLYDLALNGDMSAIREYIDRTDGKVVDKHLIAGIVSITPELLDQAQKRLTESVEATQALLKEFSNGSTDR